MNSKTASKAFHRQAVRYVIVGLGVLALDFLTFILLVHFIPAAYVIANVAGKSVGAFSGFFLHKNYTFAGQHDKSTLTQITLYFAAYAGNTALSTCIIYLGVDRLGFADVISKVVADVVVTGSSFLIGRFFVFRHRAVREIAKL